MDLAFVFLVVVVGVCAIVYAGMAKPSDNSVAPSADADADVGDGGGD